MARVWLPNNDSPGLAMARAFGDFCLKDFGLISVPDISYRRITEKDEFIVLATDGVTETLVNSVYLSSICPCFFDTKELMGEILPMILAGLGCAIQ